MMTQPTSFHDVELISAYLDNQLSLVEKANLEKRLNNNPLLGNILTELSQSRALLRKLPARRVPHNFTLSPQKAGVKPPLPRIFPIFRLASALTAILFFFVFAVNLSVPAWATIRASAPMPVLGQSGNGPPAAFEAAAPAAPQADNAMDLIPTPEMRIMQAAPTQAAIELPSAAAVPLEEPGAMAKSLPPTQGQPQPASEMQPLQLPISSALQFSLLGLAVLSAGAAYFLRARSESRWFKAHALKPGKPDPRQIGAFILALLLIIALAVSIYWTSTNSFYAP